MHTRIYDCKTYLEWIEQKHSENSEKRGYLKKLAEAANCQPSFISQVMRGKAQITPDHAIDLAVFWGLNDGETDYFLNLVLLDRAGSRAHRQYCQSKLRQLKVQNAEISKRVQSRKVVKIETQSKYYSDWLWPVIHILTSIPNFSRAEKIANALSVDTRRVREVLLELKEMGFVEEKEDGSWSIGHNRLHLDKESPFNLANHRNFRFFMLNRLAKESESDVHFSAVYGLSLEACVTIQERLLSLISEIDKVVLPSKEEQAACLTLDFVKI
jgi:uncharacterized protein (TIGR02147 family)